MKRLIIAVGLLLALFVLCLLEGAYIGRSADKLQAELDPLEQAIYSGDWQQASTAYEQYQLKWQRQDRIWRALINHTDMREVESALVRLGAALEQEDEQEALSEMAMLRYYIWHVPQTERVESGNIL